MADLKQYIASSGAGELPAEAELDVLLARCEWFDLARIVREIATGRPDSRLDVTAPWRAQSSLRMAAVDGKNFPGKTLKGICKETLQCPEKPYIM